MRQTWLVWDRVWVEEHRTMGAAEWLARCLTELGVCLPAVIFDKTVRDLELAILHGTTSLLEGVPAVLAKLVSRYKLGLISDTGVSPGRVMRELLARDGLLCHFDHLTFSDEHGRSKPHPSVFHATLAQLGVAPDRAVHVGDLLRTDIDGASAIGMRTVRYTGHRDDRQAHHGAISSVYNSEIHEADAVIATYTDLAPILDRWNNHA